VILSYEALAERMTADDLLRRIMRQVPCPRSPWKAHVRAAHDPDALLRRIEWTVLRRLDGLLYGDYRTLFRGLGLDLADLREYQLHDDVRHIDWNVTARLQTPHVREFHEDREITAWFLLDVSPSIDFGSTEVQEGGCPRVRLVCSRASSPVHGNRVGAIFYDRGMGVPIPRVPAGGRYSGSSTGS
jgi:hypothetical protein